jgi:two-component system chemotaxis sensor kinase CheA
MEKLDKMLHNFLVESQENLVKVDQKLVELERYPDDRELLDSIFRIFHSLKGSAGFLRLPLMEQIAHRTEEALTKLRKQALTLDSDLITTLLQAVDRIKSILVHLEQTGQEGEHNIQAILEALDAVIAGTSVRPSHPVPATEPTTSDVRQENTGEPETGPQNSSQQSTEDQQQGHEQDERAVNDQQISATVTQAVSAGDNSQMHVDLGVLDRLLNLTGELVLARNRLAQFAAAETVDRQAFRTVNQRVNVVVSEVQEMVVKTRMQPMQKIFGNLPRLIRDLSNTQGKEVELQIKGQETELDRTLLDAINDP